MTSTLPNIFPASSGGSFSDAEAVAVSGVVGKIGKPFDQLMAFALSPSPKETGASAGQNPPAKTIVSAEKKPNSVPAKSPGQFQVPSIAIEKPDLSEIVAGNFLLPVKNSKSGAPTSGKNPSDPAKTTNGSSDANANSIALMGITVALVNPQKILVPIPAPVTTGTNAKGELPAKNAPGVSVLDLKTVVASESAKVAANLPEVKNPAAPTGKNSNQTILPNQPVVEVKPVFKDEVQEKIAPVSKVSAKENPLAEKIIPVDPKIVASTTASLPMSQLKNDETEDLKTSTTMAESVVVPAQSEISASSDSDAKTSAQPVPEIDGTSAAKQDVPMKKSEKTNKFAGVMEKVLPGNAITPARENGLTVRTEQVAANNSDNSSANRDETVIASSADGVASSAVVDQRSRILERTQEMVLSHAVRLSSSSGDALQVVIKPGAGTQLSLELRQRGDGVEVQATLQHGDFNHLNQNWPDLQQRLEQRGIRLAPLIGDGNFANSGGNTFQQKQNQSAEAFAELVPAVPMNGTFAQPVARAGVHRGWETWA